MSEVAPPLSIGQVVDDKWRIEQLLGRGGMGAVFAAVHVRNQRKAAIKVLNADLARDPEQRQRLHREGYASNRVDHPGIVAIIDDGVTAEGAVYLVMERLQGIALDAMAESRGGQLPIEEACALFDSWLDVVAAAHAQGVIHRDLKPENAFFTRHAVVKVLDFGLAHIRDDGSARLTATGVPMGTPAFMPPEQALALWDRVDARSDVFALGASFFTLLTGKLVHDARTMPELLVWVCTRQAPPVRSVAPFIPAALAEVMDRALSFQSAERYANAGEMLLAFRHAVLSSGLCLPALQTVAKTLDQAAPGLADEATTPNARFQHGTRSDVTAIRPIAYGTVSPVSTAQRGLTAPTGRPAWLIGSLVAVGVFLVGGIAYMTVGNASETSAPEPTPADSAPAVVTLVGATTVIPRVEIAPPVVSVVSGVQPSVVVAAPLPSVKVRPMPPPKTASAIVKPPQRTTPAGKDPLGWN